MIFKKKCWLSTNYDSQILVWACFFVCCVLSVISACCGCLISTHHLTNQKLTKLLSVIKPFFFLLLRCRTILLFTFLSLRALFFFFVLPLSSFLSLSFFFSFLPFSLFLLFFFLLGLFVGSFLLRKVLIIWGYLEADYVCCF